MASMQHQITVNAARLRLLYDEIKRTFREHPHGPQHHAACSAFHSSYDALAFPGGLDSGMKRLEQQEPDSIDAAVRFLVADPWFHRSGYIKEKIIRRLKHAPLTIEQRSSLRAVVLGSVMVPRGVLIQRRLATLAPKVDSPDFRSAIQEAANSPEPGIQRRAKQVLHVLRSARKQGDSK